MRARTVSGPRTAPRVYSGTDYSFSLLYVTRTQGSHGYYKVQLLRGVNRMK